MTTISLSTDVISHGSHWEHRDPP